MFFTLFVTETFIFFGVILLKLIDKVSRSGEKVTTCQKRMHDSNIISRSLSILFLHKHTDEHAQMH